VPSLVPEEDLHVREAHLSLQALHEASPLVIRWPPGPAIRDVAFGVQRAQVGARRDVTRLQIEPQSGRAEDASSQLVLERVVPEQRQVAGAGAGSDAGADGVEESRHPPRGQAVEVGGGGFLQLRRVVFIGHPPEAVHHDEDDLRVVPDEQAGEIHGRILATGHSRNSR
jgi:hypothetical protein